MKKIQLTPDEIKEMLDLEGEFYMTVGTDWADVFRAGFIFALIYCSISVLLAILMQPDFEIAVNNVMLAPTMFVIGYWAAK